MPTIKKLKFRNKTPVSSKKQSMDNPEPRSHSAQRPSAEEPQEDPQIPIDDIQIQQDVSEVGDVSVQSDNKTKKKKAESNKKKIEPNKKQLVFNGKIRESREKTMYRDNWNYFVGDSDYKTDALLRFQEKHMKYQYHKFLLASSAYSLRILLTLTTLLNIFLTNQSSECPNYRCIKSFGVQLGIFGAAIFATTSKFGSTINKQEPIYSNIVINLVPLSLGFQSLNLYSVQQDNYVLGQELVSQFRTQNFTEQSELFEQLIILNNFDADNAFSKSLSENQLVSKSQLVNISLYLIILLHNVPFFLVMMQVTPDWLEYTGFTFASNIFYLTKCKFDKQDFIIRNIIVHALLVLIFALNEKIRKELFVVSLTNSRTKKQMMRVFNQIVPSAICSKDGSIVMCNERFEKLVTGQIGVKSVPTNLIKMIQNDEQAKNQLSDAIQNCISKSTETKEFEMILRKDKINGKGKPEEVAPEEEGEESIYNNNREAFRVTVSQVQFKSSKHCLINFESITDLKGKYRLMSLHTRHIGQSVISSQRRMEILHRQLLAQGCTDLSAQVGQFLGSSQVTYNMIQQISHYLKFTSDLDDYKIENYVLSEEIDYCLDGLTASKWEKEIEVFLTKGHLPKQVLGDLRKFRICMRTLLEFGIKYSSDHQMYVKCEFKEFTPEPERHFVIQFSLVLTKSDIYNLEPIQILFQEPHDDDENEDLSFDKQITANYNEFLKHIRDFGYGMIAFPSVVKQLKGHYFLTTGTNIDDDNGSLSNNTLPKDKLKIGFKLPFEPAPSDNVIQKSNYKINPLMKEMMDGTQIFKTPQIKSAGREVTRVSIQGLSGTHGNNTMGIGNTNPGHAAPSPANPNTSNGGNASRANGMMSNIVLGNAAFNSNQNRYASVNNQIRTGLEGTAGSVGNGPKANGVVNATEARGRSGAALRTGYATAGNDKPNGLDGNMQSSSQDHMMSSNNGGQTAMATQPHPAISAIDNTFKNMQNLQNTQSGEGSQKQGEQNSSNENNNLNNNSQSFEKGKPKKRGVIPARNSLLKNTIEEGKPRQFFGQSKAKNEYQSTSTANFIAGKPTEEAKEESSVATSQKHEGASSFGFGVGSKQQLKIDSKDDLMDKNKAFSFMEGSKQAANSSGVSVAHINSASNINSIPMNALKGDQQLLSQPSNGTQSIQQTTQSNKPGGVGSVRSNNEQSFRSKILTEIKEQKQIKNSRSDTGGIKSVHDAGEGIQVPQSAKIEGEIVGKSESKNDDFDSEIKDRVDSLQNNFLGHSDLHKIVNADENLSDLDDEKPFNFNMEKYDSFMLDSEDGLGLSYGSSKLKNAAKENVKRNPMDVIYDICRGKSQTQKPLEKSQPLSKIVRRQIFDNFAETPSGASRNLLTQGSIQDNKSTDPNVNDPASRQHSEPQAKETPVSEQKPATPQQKVEKNRFTGRPRAPKKSQNIFMQAAAVGAGVYEIEKAKYYDKNLLNLRQQGKNQVMKFEVQQKSKDYIQKNYTIQLNIEQTMIKIQQKRARDQNHLHDRRLLNVWQKNILMHPSVTNAEYDAMDRGQTLKTFNMILEDIENQNKQQWLKPSVQSPKINDQQNDSLAQVVKKQQVLVGVNQDSQPAENEPKGKQMMLIVEDNQFIQQAIQCQLTQIGVDFESCLNGQEAVDIVEKYLQEGKMFDIILMDLIMPVMNGFKASAEIRELEKKYNIPESKKLFICGYSSQVGLDTEKKSFDNGMDDIVAKPMNLKALQRMLSENDRRKLIKGSSNNPSSVQQHVSPISESRQSPLPRMQLSDNVKSQREAGYNTAQIPKTEEAAVQIAGDAGRK